jgi:6-phosphogluconolactonase (cycloisomerase 2 family)
MEGSSSVGVSLSAFTAWTVLFMAAPVLIACGGGSGSSSSTVGGNGNGSVSVLPASGEYLWVNPGPLDVATINATTGELGPLNQTGILEGTIPVLFPSANTLYLVGGADGSTLQRYTLSGPGLQLDWDSGWKLELGHGPFLQHPSGKFMYVFDGWIQLIYIEQGGQDLNLGPAVENQATSFTMGAMDPTGKFLFAFDVYGSGIYAYQINQTTGALTPVAGSPFALPAYNIYVAPGGFVMGGSGTSLFLYVSLGFGSSSSGIVAFAINPSTGALSPVPGSPFQTSDDNSPGLCVDSSGKFLYAAVGPLGSDYAGAIYGFQINSLNGTLSPMASSPFASGVVGYRSPVLDPSGRFLYATGYESGADEWGVYGFSLDSATGALSQITGSPFFNSNHGSISEIGTSNIP